jgi:hypothetical protein
MEVWHSVGQDVQCTPHNLEKKKFYLVDKKKTFNCFSKITLRIRKKKV